MSAESKARYCNPDDTLPEYCSDVMDLYDDLADIVLTWGACNPGTPEDAAGARLFKYAVLALADAVQA